MKLIAHCNNLDRRATEEAGLSVEILMENAGTQLAEFIQARFQQSQGIVLVCGTGNNGGDGLVCARKLWEAGYQNLQVVMAGSATARTSLENKKRVLSLKIPLIDYLVDETNAISALSEAEIIVDALFGSGLNREISGSMAALVKMINERSPSTSVLAVDMPSGIDSETGQILGVAVQARMTCTLACGKPGLYLYPGKERAGIVHVLNIGIPACLIDSDPSQFQLMTHSQAAQWLPPRDLTDHKYDHGHVLVVAGNAAMPGAAALCTEAATRSGAGLVTLATPKNALKQLALPPEAMRLLLRTETHLDLNAVEQIQEALKGRKFHSVLIGPGLGRHSETLDAILDLLAWLMAQAFPVVLDADALYALAQHPRTLTDWFFLTPHVGEASRLLEQEADILLGNLPQAAVDGAERFGAQFILKSASTVVTSPLDDKTQAVWINPAGNSGMATAGSGDVLSGILAGLLAQANAKGLPLAPMGPLAVYLHSLAGDHAAQDKTVYGMRASDITAHLPDAFRQLLPHTLPTECAKIGAEEQDFA